MRINVRWGYAVSLGVYIPAGEYAIDDEALQGLGQYLLDNGHALPVGESAQPDWMAIADSVDDDAEGDDEDWINDIPVDNPSADLIAVARGMDFDNMTRAELRALWGDLGFEGASGMSKTDLVEKLIAWKAAQG